LSHGVSVLVLCQGGGMANAIGLSALAVAVSLAGLIVTGQFDNVPNPKEPAYPWILLLLAIANSLLGGGAVGTGSVYFCLYNRWTTCGTKPTKNSSTLENFTK